ncbi:hypothetical protein GGF32_000462 [Allomyces javanicus]|nr:hypothetical protein GGF32_000462 [Allomyces javanicus]
MFIDGTPEDDDGRIISAVENMFVAGLPRHLVALQLAGLYDYLPPGHSAVELPNVVVPWPPTLRSLVFDVGTDDGWMGTFTSRFFDSPLPPLTELCVDDVDLFMMVDRARIVTTLLPTLTSFSLTVARGGESTATFVGLDALIRELATRCPLLAKLSVNTFHAPMTGDELVLCARNTIPHLHALPMVDLALKGWFDKGPEAAAPVLSAVAAAMPNLRSLNLLCSYSKPIAAYIVHDLVRLLKYLKRIGVKVDSGHEALAEVLKGINPRMVTDSLTPTNVSVSSASHVRLRLFTHPPLQLSAIEGMMGFLSHVDKPPGVYHVMSRGQFLGTEWIVSVVGPIALRHLRSMYLSDVTASLLPATFPTIRRVYCFFDTIPVARLLLKNLTRLGGIPPSITDFAVSFERPVLVDPNGLAIIQQLAALLAVSRTRKLIIFMRDINDLPTNGNEPDLDLDCVTKGILSLLENLPQSLVSLTIKGLTKYAMPNVDGHDKRDCVRISWPTSLKSLAFNVGGVEGDMGPFMTRFIRTGLPVGLTMLSLEDIVTDSDAVVLRIVSALVPTLTSFRLRLSKEYVDMTESVQGLRDIVKALVATCPAVHTLTLDLSKTMFGDRELNFMTNEIVPLLALLPITDLGLQGWHLTPTTVVSTNLLATVAMKLPNLEVLDLSDSRVGIGHLQLFVLALRQLKQLTLSGDDDETWMLTRMFSRLKSGFEVIPHDETIEDPEKEDSCFYLHQ